MKSIASLPPRWPAKQIPWWAAQMRSQTGCSITKNAGSSNGASFENALITLITSSRDRRSPDEQLRDNRSNVWHDRHEHFTRAIRHVHLLRAPLHVCAWSDRVIWGCPYMVICITDSLKHANFTGTLSAIYVIS